MSDENPFQSHRCFEDDSFRRIRIKRRSGHGPLEPIQATSTMLEVSQAVHYAHEKGGIRKRFHTWWESLSPPASYQGVPLEKQAAFAVWMAAEENNEDLLQTCYESMEATCDLRHRVAYEEACYLLFLVTGKDSYSFQHNDYLEWLRVNCESARREYSNGTITITYSKPAEPRSLP